MHKQNISSFKALSKVAGVSEYQIQRLRKGEIQQMRLEFLVKLSQALQIDLNELINDFSETIFSSAKVQPGSQWTSLSGFLFLRPDCICLFISLY